MAKYAINPDLVNEWDHFHDILSGFKLPQTFSLLNIFSIISFLNLSIIIIFTIFRIKLKHAP